MGEKKGSRFMVQGADPLVPVVIGGGKAGPTRPSSLDRGLLEVGNQATSNVTASGMDYADPFKRRDRINKTPPRAGKDPTPRSVMEPCVLYGDKHSAGHTEDTDPTIPIDSTGDDDQVFSEDGQTGEKRKRDETPEKVSKEMEDLKRMIDGLAKSAVIMKGLIDSNPNTKLELKKEVLKIK